MVPLLRRRPGNETLKTKAMNDVKFPSDRTILSTDNNGFAGDERDENLVAENLWESEIPTDDRIPDATGEIDEDNRPVYDEEGYGNDPGPGH